VFYIKQLASQLLNGKRMNLQAIATALSINCAHASRSTVVAIRFSPYPSFCQILIHVMIHVNRQPIAHHVEHLSRQYIRDHFA